jgi:2-polyprenyl-3-methyl-5-hydroxy-6-metoxy-1,4-benzoquinol methylase
MDTEAIRHKVVDDYRRKAQQRFNEYETSDNGWLDDFIEFLPTPPAKLLDIGSGSGRDAAWYAARGYAVTAVEPATELRELAQKKHPSSNICWVDDHLPSLKTLYDQFEFFAHIHMNAVIFHLPPIETRGILERVHELLQPNGTFFVALRNGPKDPERPMFDVDKDHVIEQAQGLFHLVTVIDGADSRSRPGITWDRLLWRKI